VLEAIHFDQWIDEATEGERAYSGGMLHAVKGGFDPVKTPWGREYAVSEAAFLKWLKEAKRRHEFAGRPKRRPGSKPGLREKIAAFIKDEYPDDPPPGVTNKEIARRAKGKLGLDRTPSERTVRRANGRQ
jgi:hypothetical protein